MFKKTLIVVAVLIVALAISAFSWLAITNAELPLVGMNADLTTYNAEDATAYRWEAIGQFYEEQNQMMSGDMTVDSAYNWNALVNAKSDELKQEFEMVEPVNGSR